MSNLKNAPLIYTIGVVNFPLVPKFGDFLVQFHENIRDDYPLPAEFVVQDISAQLSSEGLHVETKETKQWQFASIDNDWAIVLTETMFCLHTVKYLDFEDFVSRFSNAFRSLVDIPDIKIRHLLSMGFRHVDMIAPPAETSLEDYLQSWVLPQTPIASPLTMEEGVYVAKFMTPAGHLRFQALRKPPFTLPPDLATPATIQNGWVRERPGSDFVLIDTDHVTRFEKGMNVDIPLMTTKLKALHDIASELFLAVGTETAMRHWRGEEEHATH